MTATYRHLPGRDDPGAERRRALAGVDRDYPPWHAWPGALAGVLYARRPGTSPPMVVRSITPDGPPGRHPDANPASRAPALEPKFPYR